MKKWTYSNEFHIFEGERLVATTLSNEHARKDAPLIAAAPDLLGQLKYVTIVLQNWLPDKSTELRAECYRIIAKAEGKE